MQRRSFLTALGVVLAGLLGPRRAEARRPDSSRWWLDSSKPWPALESGRAPIPRAWRYAAAGRVEVIALQDLRPGDVFHIEPRPLINGDGSRCKISEPIYVAQPDRSTGRPTVIDGEGAWYVCCRPATGAELRQATTS